VILGPVIWRAGLSGVLLMAAQTAIAHQPVCPPIGPYFKQDAAQQVLRIIPGCLGHPDDVGVAMGDISGIVVDAVVVQTPAANPTANDAAAAEILVESFVSEILTPTVSAPAN